MSLNLNIEKQNSKEMLELLSAQRNVYSRAKKYFYLSFFSSIIPIIVKMLGFKDLEKSMMIGIFFTFLTNFLLIINNKLVNKGANIQEQFDTKIFSINWNCVLIDKIVSIEFIKKHVDKSNFNDLMNWYSIPNTGDIKKDTLVCQYNNANWTLKQSKICKNYCIFIYAILIVLCFFIFPMYYVAIILPILSFLRKNFVMFNNTIKSEKSIVKSVKESIENPKIISDQYIRQIQDSIYITRCNTVTVPDFVYYLFRNKNEKAMKESTEIIKRLYK
ncbi:S-4TM family putative pore-forming effector [Lactobacillus sp. Sy-1]|uniref:S-4TM family putative pore-forming effector n=1 Tax=Lactobacillus sp. Sy-1 TaxID=2109645 RepID=UPI001C5B34CB|nr:S-4TM family putative pore-forming effector [Lactobacillus sp. Sy-1]MBW1606070.1 hypothetical protein [Lactobacillus sp. Sy-1]